MIIVIKPKAIKTKKTREPVVKEWKTSSRSGRRAPLYRQEDQQQALSILQKYLPVVQLLNNNISNI
jgi:hypothetical protein